MSLTRLTICVAGVDLSNICISYDECDDHWLEGVAAQVDVISSAVGDGKPEALASFEVEPVITALKAITAFCTGEAVDRVRNAKKLLAARQALNAVANLWARDVRELVIEAMRTAEVGHTFASPMRSSHGPDCLSLKLSLVLQAMAEDDEANRDQFWPMSMGKLSQVAATYQDDREVMKVCDYNWCH